MANNLSGYNLDTLFWVKVKASSLVGQKDSVSRLNRVWSLMRLVAYQYKTITFEGQEVRLWEFIGKLQPQPTTAEWQVWNIEGALVAKALCAQTCAYLCEMEAEAKLQTVTTNPTKKSKEGRVVNGNLATVNSIDKRRSTTATVFKNSNKYPSNWIKM